MKVIFGASKAGKIALQFLGKENVECFIDNDQKKHGCTIEEKPIFELQEFMEKYQYKHKEYEIIIASSYKKEIAVQLRNHGLKNFKAFNFNIDEMIEYKNDFKIEELELGKLFEKSKESINLKSICFMAWGSSILDYAFIRTIVKKYNLKKYLEVGTFIGESIANVCDLCDEIYGISLPDNSDELNNFFKSKEIDNFAGLLLKDKNKVKRVMENSLNINFEELNFNPEISFIDGLHTYNGVFSDTKNVMKISNMEESFIIWHDVKNNRGEYNSYVVKAIYDALGNEYFKNVFSFDLNMCGIYVPNKYKKDFEELKRLKKNEIHNYDITIETNCTLI